MILLYCCLLNACISFTFWRVLQPWHKFTLRQPNQKNWFTVDNQNLHESTLSNITAISVSLSDLVRLLLLCNLFFECSMISFAPQEVYITLLSVTQWVAIVLVTKINNWFIDWCIFNVILWNIYWQSKLLIYV